LDFGVHSTFYQLFIFFLPVSHLLTHISSYFTSPASPPRNYPEGFQGNAIPLDGKVVAELCVKRITLAIAAD
jgi:hypothetical protein